jgi:DNA polymerase-4
MDWWCLMSRTIFLLDIDCFFASVEMALHPELCGKPVCVGGRRDDRGIVACPNYEARAYGVRTAMPLRTAARLLPSDAIFLPGNHKLYGEYSDRVMEVLEEFTPDIEQVSIDEAYMDVAGCLHFWRDAEQMAITVKERIRSRCGLSVSIGIASNKVCAKIAAGLKKPDGLVTVLYGSEREFLIPLPVEVVPGVGLKTRPKLNARGIITVGDLLSSPWGRKTHIGQYLTAVIEGQHESILHYDRVEQSISRDTTFGEDTADREFVLATLYYLAERCCKALRKRQQRALTVTVKIRYADFTTIQKQTTFRLPTAHEENVFGVARSFCSTLFLPHRLVRLVGVKVSRLLPADGGGSQMELGVVASEKLGVLHNRLDVLQEKHGYQAIHWGITHTLDRWKPRA